MNTKMNKASLLIKTCSLVFAFLASTSHAQSTFESDKVAIEAAVHTMVENKQLVGIAIGLYDNGKTAFVYGGHRSLHQAYPIDENVRFEIGSISKTFTGILLAEAVIKGELRLETPINELLKPAVNNEALSKITLRQLSTHSSGLPRLPSNMAPKNGRDPYVDYSKTELNAFLTNLTSVKPADDEVVYSNLAVGLLGVLLSQNSDTSFDDLVSKTIFAPLEMTEAYVNTPLSPLKNLALPHNDALTPQSPWRFDTMAAAGGISATLPDMMKYLEANITHDNTLKDAISLSQTTKFKGFDESTKMGLAWITRELSTGTALWHNGGTGGSRSFIGFNPSTQKGLVVLANASVSLEPAAFAYLEDKVQAHLATMIAEIEQDKPSEADLAQLIGDYPVAPTFILSVTQDKDRLFVQATNQQKLEVFPKSKLRFFYKAVEAEIEFYVDDNGRAQSLTLFQGGREMPAQRTP